MSRDIRVTTRPLSQRVACEDVPARFDSAYSDTHDLLCREALQLKARRIIIEADFDSSQIRNDGQPRATARPASPAVCVVLLGTPHGDLHYPCGKFDTWQANVRAVALALESLRRVDRYGVAAKGQQYTGWAQLPAPSRGAELIAMHGSRRAALIATHPDNGGSHEDFVAVQQAAESDDE